MKERGRKIETKREEGRKIEKLLFLEKLRECGNCVRVCVYVRVRVFQCVCVREREVRI